MKDLYRTITAHSTGSYKEKGSRFMAFAYPVEQEEEIREKIDTLKKKYHDARHHCFAWRLGAEMDRYRVNDDGEPAGSAGRPILGQIQSKDLTNLVVVVVRYFGGTKLGMGGLIQAYRAATSDALENASIEEKKVKSRIGLEFSYEQMNGVMRVIKEMDLSIENQQFDLACSLTLNIWIRTAPSAIEKLSKIEGCKILYL